jgi:hypothetical protein
MSGPTPDWTGNGRAFDAALRGPKDRFEQKQINQVSQARIMYRSRRVVR